MDLCKVRLTYLDPRSLLCSLLKVFLPRLNSHFQMSGGVKLKLALEVSLSNRNTHTSINPLPTLEKCIIQELNRRP